MGYRQLKFVVLFASFRRPKALVIGIYSEWLRRTQQQKPKYIAAITADNTDSILALFLKHDRKSAKFWVEKRT